MNFMTYGPFEFEEVSPEAIRQVFREIKDLNEGLKDAVGVYVFASRAGKVFKPLYVGKTDRGFGGRVRKQLDSGRFSDQLGSNARLNLFLIAQVTPKGNLKKVSGKMLESKGMKAINELEFSLIGSCFALNPNLLNRSEIAFHKSIHVPGYWNSPAADWDESAKKLAAMLKATK